MSKIVVINGSGGVGKSTFISLCNQVDPRVIETSTVDFVKEVARFAGWNGVKNEKSRKLLSDLKDALEEFDEIPNKKVDDFIKSHPNNIIFVNAREPENIKYYVEKYNAKTVLVRNPRITSIKSNHADLNVEQYDYNYYINNKKDLVYLKELAEIFLEIIN